jgi:hypothetical protein
MKKKVMSDKLPKNYFSFSFGVIQSILLIASGLALLLLAILFAVITHSEENRFYFRNSPLTYAFFIVIGFLLLDMVGVALLHVLNKDGMPTFEEFKRSQAAFQNSRAKTRFPELIAFDEAHPDDFTKEPTDPGLDLASVCSRFRDYMASSSASTTPGGRDAVRRLALRQQDHDPPGHVRAPARPRSPSPSGASSACRPPSCPSSRCGRSGATCSATTTSSRAASTRPRSWSGSTRPPSPTGCS